MTRSFGPSNDSPLIPAFAFLFACTGLLAAVPYGSIGFIPKAAVVAVVWVLAALGFWLSSSTNYAPPKRRARFLMPLLVVLLLGWVVVQTLPLDLCPAMRAPAKMAARLAGSGFPIPRSLAADPWSAGCTLVLWLGYAMLAWSASRLLGGANAHVAAACGIVSSGLVEAGLAIFGPVDPATSRAVGTFLSADALGGFLVMTSVVTLGLFFSFGPREALRGREGWRWWLMRLGNDWRLWARPALLMGLLFQFAAIWASGSRGATIASLGAYTIIFFWRTFESTTRKLHFIVAGLLVVVAAIFLHVNAPKHTSVARFGFRDGAETIASDASIRASIWQAAVRVCRDFPLGVGPSGTPSVLPMYQNAGQAHYELDHAHNDYLQFLGDLGRPGAAVLLLIVALALLRGARHSVRSHRNARSAWLPRGLAMAVLAAMVHSVAEFNLSVRPALQLMFLVICTLLWCPPLSARKQQAALAGLPCRRPLAQIGAVLAGVLALVVAGTALAAAWAWRTYDASRVALGIEADRYDWVALPPVDPDQALPLIEQTAKRLPLAPPVRRSVAAAALALHEKKVEAAATALIPPPDDSELLPPPQVLDFGNPEHRRYLALASLALRIEEAERLTGAMDHVLAARTLAPWDAEGMLLHAEILLRGLPMHLFGPDALDEALAELHLATELRPCQAHVFASAADVLSIAPDPATYRDTLLGWGMRAMALDSTLATKVLDAWWRAGLSYTDILDVPDLPVTVVWRLYRLLAQQHTAVAAVAQEQCLDRLQATIATATLPPNAIYWSTAMRQSYFTSLARSSLQLSAERTRRALRAGDFEAVAASAPEREKAARERTRFRLNLGPTDSDADAAATNEPPPPSDLRSVLGRIFRAQPDAAAAATNAPATIAPEAARVSSHLRRFRLRDAEANWSLPAYWRAEWILAELDTSTALRDIKEPLEELLLLDALTPAQLARLQTKQFALSVSPGLSLLLQARTDADEGRPLAASRALATLAADGDLPRRLQHRLWLWKAALDEAADQPADAAVARDRAAQLCPYDPDTQPAAAATNAPAVPLDLTFAGGRICVLGYTVAPGTNPKDSAEKTLLLHLRFFGSSLPPDLRLVVRSREPNNRFAVSSALVLDEQPDAHYNHGNPALGAAYVAPLRLTRRFQQSPYLSIELIAARKLLPQDDELAPPVLPMPAGL